MHGQHGAGTGNAKEGTVQGSPTVTLESSPCLD